MNKIISYFLFVNFFIIFSFYNFDNFNYKDIILFNNLNNIKNENELLLDSFETIVFIGDSRTVGLSNSIDNEKNIIFICEVGKGLNWLKEQNISKYNSEDTLYLINLGINDLYNIDSYINYLKSLNLKNLCYILVGPVNEDKEELFGYEIKNYEIEKFNDKIKENFQYIDLYSYLTFNNFETNDGLHYSNKTYESIFKYLKEIKEP